MSRMSTAFEKALSDVREEIESLALWGAEDQAAGAERAVALIEDAFRAALMEPLHLTEAAAESGYSVDHLSRLIREGTIPNAGKPNAPRIRRMDLPRKPGHQCHAEPGSVSVRPVTSPSRIVRSVVEASVNGGDDGHHE